MIIQGEKSDHEEAFQMEIWIMSYLWFYIWFDQFTLKKDESFQSSILADALT